MMSRTAKIGTKLLVGFSMMFAIALALSTAWFIQIRGLTSELESAVNVTAKKQLLAGEIRTSSAEMLAAENGMVLDSILQRKALVSQGKQDFATQFAHLKSALTQFRPLSDPSALSHLDTLD